MEDSRLPAIELVQGPQPHQTATASKPPGRRWRLFIGVFLIVAGIGLAYTYSRSPVYRTTATVLTVKPKAVDQRSEAADAQHVVIQERLLLDADLLQTVSDKLAEQTQQVLSVSELRLMLSVSGLEQTNLVALNAEGTDPALLASTVNIWAQAYEDFRAAQIQQAARETTTELSEEQQRLQSTIEQRKLELQAFRRNNNIQSLQRDENRVTSRLKGLQTSLNRAREKLVDSNAHLAAVKLAIQRGDTVVPSEQRASLKERMLQASALRTKLQQLHKRYTQVYIDGDPSLKVLPEKLAELESSIKRSQQLGQAAVLEQASQDVETAEQAVQALESELNAHEEKVKTFSERFEQHKRLKADLAELEKLYADTNKRLTQIQIRNRKKYPPVQVVDQARTPEHPIYPDYQRDAGISLLIALITALFVTWLREYLDGQQRSVESGYTGIRVFTNNPTPTNNIALQQDAATTSLAHQQPQGLLPGAEGLLELEPAAIHSLIETAEPATRGCILLLLNGISVEELITLSNEDLSLDEFAVEVPNNSQRTLKLSSSSIQPLREMLDANANLSQITDIDDLNSRLFAAGIDAGISDAHVISADNIRFTYLVFLVRQGVRLAELPQRTGRIQPGLLQQLAVYSPPGKNKSMADITTEFPLMAAGV